MAVGATAVGGVDSVRIAVKHAGTAVHVFGVGGVWGFEFGSNGKRAAAQHALQSAGRGVAGQYGQRVAGNRFVVESHAMLLMRFSRALL